jgi:hypothetical protein
MNDQVNSAKVGTYLLYIRPFVESVYLLQIKPNLTHDDSRFYHLTISSLLFASGVIESTMEGLFLLSLLTVATFMPDAFILLLYRKVMASLFATELVGLISLVGHTRYFYGPAIGTYWTDHLAN